MGTNPTSRVYRFGVFEADRQTGELRKQGRRLPLQGQPLEVLLLLLERAGEMVPRAEICQRLWPDGTFVDFDHSLNTAVNKIRETLGDSASSPRFVETLARRGYRFIAPVETEDSRPAAGERRSNPAAEVATVSPMPEPPQAESVVLLGSGLAQRIFSRPHEMPQAPQKLVRILFFLLQLMYLGFYVVALARLNAVEDVLDARMAHTLWAVVLLIATAVAGIPTRLYLMAAVVFRAPGLRQKFLRLFPAVFPLDELWALAPFLLLDWIGYGLALAGAAVLLYSPFAQRSLILMGAGAPARDRQAAN